MPVTDDTVRYAGTARGRLDRVVDGVVRDVTAAYSRALLRMLPDWQATVQRLTDDGGASVPVNSAAARELAAAVSVALTQLTRYAQDRVVRALETTTAAAVRDQLTLVGSGLPVAYAVQLARVDAAAVAAMIARAEEDVTGLLDGVPELVAAAVMAELVSGVLLGVHPGRVAARMADAFTGGLTRAMVVARTEMLDAYRAAAQATRLANTDVVTGWRWLATLSTRTCPGCLAMHGTVHPLTEPGPDGHQQCRCMSMPVVTSWSELGVAAAEPDDVFPDADDWFETLTPAEQKGLLGPVRYRAWAAGFLPLSGMAVRRTNPGWRDSWVPIPVADVERLLAAVKSAA